MTQRSKHTKRRSTKNPATVTESARKTAASDAGHAPQATPAEVAQRHAADVQRLLETSAPEGREFMRLLTLDHLEKNKADLTAADLERLAKLQGESPATSHENALLCLDAIAQAAVRILANDKDHAMEEYVGALCRSTTILRGILVIEGVGRQS